MLSNEQFEVYKMDTTEIFKELKRVAHNVSDINNTKLYIDYNVSKCVRNQIKDMCKSELTGLQYDLQSGIVIPDEYDNESAILNCILRSL